MSGSAISDSSVQVKDNINRPEGLAHWWPRPLNRGDRLTEVKTKVTRMKKLRPLKTDPFNTVPLSTGSTVLMLS